MNRPSAPDSRRPYTPTSEPPSSAWSLPQLARYLQHGYRQSETTADHIASLESDLAVLHFRIGHAVALAHAKFHDQRQFAPWLRRNKLSPQRAYEDMARYEFLGTEEQARGKSLRLIDRLRGARPDTGTQAHILDHHRNLLQRPDIQRRRERKEAKADATLALDELTQHAAAIAHELPPRGRALAALASRLRRDLELL